MAINDIPMEGVTLHAALKVAHEMTEAVKMKIEFDVEGMVRCLFSVKRCALPHSIQIQSCLQVVVLI